jgi:arylsulfotransferase ASST
LGLAATDGIIDVPLTRGRLLALGGGALATLLFAPRTLAASPAVLRAPYVSRPDLVPPPITVLTPDTSSSGGYIFLAPFDITAAQSQPSGPASSSRAGPLIVDARGEPVWFLPLGTLTAMNVRVQRYRRRRVLTWYEGTVLGAYGGDYVVFDPTYHEVVRVKAAGGRHGDLHEFLLTSRGTALITIYREITADLTSVGGAADARLVEGIVQEVDVATDKLLFEWRSHEHVPPEESFMTNVTPQGNVDYFHLNSVAVDRDGHLLVSSRHTSTIYKVNRKTGDVMWRLGGKRSDFSFDPGAAFSFQHDARRQQDGSLTVFDNAAALPGPAVSSRGVRLAVDERARRVSLLQEWRPPDRRSGWAMGNVQALNGGGVFVGWGTDGSFSEFGPDGELRFDARFADGSVGYRAFRLAWTGHPTGRPAVAARASGGGTSTVYASWNGSTDVARWQVLSGPRVVASAPRSGFETAIPVSVAGGSVTVAAVSRSGARLGVSDTLRL